LVIDDEPQLARMIALTLEGHGYRTIVAHNGQEGLELWHQHRSAIKLIIVDMLMPKIDGFGVMREVKAIDPRCKIIAMSGTETLTHDRCGGGLFLSKPFNPDDLLEAVANLLK
jgi:CheY-like chemotaxis protein